METSLKCLRPRILSLGASARICEKSFPLSAKTTLTCMVPSLKSPWPAPSLCSTSPPGGVNLAISTDDKDRGSLLRGLLPSTNFPRAMRMMNAVFVVIAAGNTAREKGHLYPYSNMTDGVQDPGQSWNALTVGAYTEKCCIDEAEYPEWQPVASYGDLSPCSCTSMDWEAGWPLENLIWSWKAATWQSIRKPGWRTMLILSTF